MMGAPSRVVLFDAHTCSTVRLVGNSHMVQETSIPITGLSLMIRTSSTAEVSRPSCARSLLIIRQNIQLLEMHTSSWT